MGVLNAGVHAQDGAQRAELTMRVQVLRAGSACKREAGLHCEACSTRAPQGDHATEGAPTDSRLGGAQVLPMGTGKPRGESADGERNENGSPLAIGITSMGWRAAGCGTDTCRMACPTPLFSCSA